MKSRNNGDKAKAKLRRVQLMEDRLSIKLDELWAELFGMEIDGGGSRRPDPRPLQYADSLRVSYDARGNALVSINGSKPFGMSPELGLLLPVLALETSESIADCADDSSVPWKSFEEIRAKMAKALGREFTDRALKEAVHRLRMILEDHAFVGLLQTNRVRRAYRFALRRKCASVLVASL